MLKKIPDNLNPDLFKIRMEGNGTCDILESILKFFPLDTFVKKPVTVMKVVGDDKLKPIIWVDYERIIKEQDNKIDVIESIERFEFYERSKKAYAIVSTSEKSLYACMIIKKGVKND